MTSAESHLCSLIPPPPRRVGTCLAEGTARGPSLSPEVSHLLWWDTLAKTPPTTTAGAGFLCLWNSFLRKRVSKRWKTCWRRRVQLSRSVSTRAYLHLHTGTLQLPEDGPADYKENRATMPLALLARLFRTVPPTTLTRPIIHPRFPTLNRPIGSLATAMLKQRNCQCALIHFSVLNTILFGKSLNVMTDCRRR